MFNVCIPLSQKYLVTLQLEYGTKNYKGVGSKAIATSMIMIVRSNYRNSLQYSAYPN